MEQVNLEKMAKEIALLRSSIEEMKEIIMENSLEISDEVKKEIEESRKKPLSSFISQEDVEARFLNDN